MITMEMLGKVRRMYLRDKLSLHEITKRTGLSRNTIRGWLRKPEDPARPTYRRTLKSWQADGVSPGTGTGAEGGRSSHKAEPAHGQGAICADQGRGL